jgi:hypothetical protein
VSQSVVGWLNSFTLDEIRSNFGYEAQTLPCADPCTLADLMHDWGADEKDVLC